MKKLLFLIFIMGVFTACSKKSDNQPTNSVTINGSAYSTVIIGSQTWTSVNYNGSGGENYNNGSNSQVYGKLYTYAEAQAIVLPAGWRLPTQNDFNNLSAAIGEQDLNGAYVPIGGHPLNLMSQTDWISVNGNNSLGFNAEPAGLYRAVTANNQVFTGLGATALFLSSTLYFTNGTFPYTFVLDPYDAQLTDLVILPTDRASVRFVRDN